MAQAVSRRPVYMRFLVDKVALGWVFQRILWRNRVSINPSTLHVYWLIRLWPTR